MHYSREVFDTVVVSSNRMHVIWNTVPILGVVLAETLALWNSILIGAPFQVIFVNDRSIK